MWVAATLGESKIPKSYALSCRIHVLCENIERPAAPFALRLSASLMLGVVRVYSRKSEFVLKDVQAIVEALKRFDVHSVSKSMKRRRTRDTASSYSTHAHGAGISLEDGDDVARLDLITLPAAKKRRGRTYAIPAPKRSRSTRSKDTETERNMSLGDISIPEATELNVMEAMENLFPAVVVPRLSPFQGGRSRTPGHLFPTQSERSLVYKAREEDITLAPPATHLGDLDQEVFLGDLPVSLDSRPASIASQPFSAVVSGNDVDSVAIRPFGVASEVPSSAAQGDQDSGAGDNLEHDLLAVPEPDDMQPLEIGPFDLEDATSHLSRRDRSPLRGPGDLPVSSTRQSVISGQVTSDARSGKKSILTTSGHQSSTRTKRYTPIRFDEVTELSADQIRESLNDTTDIVLAPGEVRYPKKRGKRAGASPRHKFLPHPISSFPQDITDIWEELTGNLLGISELPIADGQSLEERLSSGGKSPPQVDAETPSPARPEIDPILPEVRAPEVPLVADEPMVVEDPFLGRGETEPGAVEVLRRDTIHRESPAALSHSRSMRNKSGTGSHPSASSSLQRRTARLRDHILEQVSETHTRTDIGSRSACFLTMYVYPQLQITEADRKSFEHARLHGSSRRPSGLFVHLSVVMTFFPFVQLFSNCVCFYSTPQLVSRVRNPKSQMRTSRWELLPMKEIGKMRMTAAWNFEHPIFSSSKKQRKMSSRPRLAAHLFCHWVYVHSNCWSFFELKRNHEMLALKRRTKME